MYRWFLMFPCFLIWISSSYAAQPVEDLSSLIDDLRKGGYVLYVRHGEANIGEDQPDLSLTDCSTQRNLSAISKEQAKQFGEAIRKLNIPLAYPVESSPLCRTVQTAETAFGTPNVKVNEFWLNIYELSKNLTADQTQRILQAFTTEVEHFTPDHANRVIVAHAFPPGIGLGDIPNLGTVILKPLGNHKGYQIVGRSSLEQLLQEAGMQ